MLSVGGSRRAWQWGMGVSGVWGDALLVAGIGTEKVMED